MTNSWLSTAVCMEMFFHWTNGFPVAVEHTSNGPELFINVASYTHTLFGLGSVPSDRPHVWDVKIL